MNWWWLWQVTSTHVGMLVCGIFNASVASKSMGNGLSFDTIAGEWRGSGGQVIAVGSTVRIVVTRWVRRVIRY